MKEFIKAIKKQVFHCKHEIYTQLAYRLPFLPPYRYVFVLTNLCNMRCKNCFQEKTSDVNRLTKKQWIDISNKIPSLSRVTVTGGEPLIYPDIRDILKEIAGRHQCNLITNGTLLTEDLIEDLLSFPRFRILAVSIDNLLTGKVNIRGYTEKQWKDLGDILKIFIRRRDGMKSECLLEIKTLILDENAEELFDIHRYCMETLRADHHSFQFLKGSPLQHSIKSTPLDEIFKTSPAPVYKKFDTIMKEINRIKAYNIKNNYTSFLHPNVSDIHTEKPISDISYLNTEQFDRSRFGNCKFPWSSVHINYDGQVFPCLSVSMGNLKEKDLDEILRGRLYRDFLRATKKSGLFQACNRCGWLRPIRNANKC